MSWNCYGCGREMADNDTIYPLPIYDPKPLEKSFDVKAHGFCWDCFLRIAEAIRDEFQDIRIERAFKGPVCK